MIDVHILVTGAESKLWYQECVNSLAGRPVSLHVCNGILGDIPKSRALAISKGIHDYVGWVDSDDYALPGAYGKLLSVIGDAPFAWMNEYEYKYNMSMRHVSTSVRTQPHHIHIIHRDVLDYTIIENPHDGCEYSKVWTNAPAEIWIRKYMSVGVHLNDVGYVYRRYNKKALKTIQENQNVR